MKTLNAENIEIFTLYLKYRIEGLENFARQLKKADDEVNGQLKSYRECLRTFNCIFDKS